MATQRRQPLTARSESPPTVRNLADLSKRRLLENVEPNAMGASTLISAGEKKTVLRNQAGDHDIQLVTLYLYALPSGQQVVVTQPPGLAGSFFSNGARVVFEVTWGVGGSTPFVVLVSVKQGTAITLAASSVVVSALYDEDPAASPPVLTVGAALSYGPRPPVGAYEPASFDVRFTLPGNDIQTLVVPPFARRLTILSNDAVRGVALTRLSFAGGFPAVTISETQGVANQKELVATVPDGASSVEVINNEVAEMSFVAVWSLGI